MKERPILFSGPMVRAILDGRKTQTRRIVTVPWDTPKWRGRCKYGQPGDRLWVRETWCHKFDEHARPVYNSQGNLDQSCVWYKADGDQIMAMDEDGGRKFRQDGMQASPWRPSIHMPRWASRIALEVTEVRVERLQDISAFDALAEGINAKDHGAHSSKCNGLMPEVCCYRNLWNSIHGPGAWNANPWVWVVSFRKINPALCATNPPSSSSPRPSPQP